MARIDVHALGKTYGSVMALDDMTFSALPGRVTGLLGPNGSGKSTTMRLMVGLTHGTGSVLYDGQPYQSFANPARRVGALLDANSWHPGRSARNHLRMVAAGLDMPTQRCEEVLDLVGLSDVGDRRVGKFSTGMCQRLGLGTALLGEPDTLILDEPANGLDPQGMSWLKDFLRSYADQGNTLLLSSHVLSELEEFIDDVVVIGKGKLLACDTIADFLNSHCERRIVARVDRPQSFTQILNRQGGKAGVNGAWVEVRGLSLERVGLLARKNEVTVYEQFAESGGLERGYLSVSDQGRGLVKGVPQTGVDLQVTA